MHLRNPIERSKIIEIIEITIEITVETGESESRCEKLGENGMDYFV